MPETAVTEQKDAVHAEAWIRVAMPAIYARVLSAQTVVANASAAILFLAADLG